MRNSFTKTITSLLAILLNVFTAGLIAQTTYPMPGFTLPAGKTICITYEVDVNACSDGVPSDELSNQATVSGTNFAMITTDDPDVGGASDPTITPYNALKLGDLVFEDVDGSGTFNMGDIGINGVMLNLYIDDGDGVLDAGDGVPVATTVTMGGGFYSFDVCTGDYIVEVDPSNFMMGGVLYNGGSPFVSSPIGGASDPDDDMDNDDNGDPVVGFGVATQAVTLSVGGEPVNDGDLDNNTNLSVDFSFIKGTSITISDVTMNEGSGGGSTNFEFTVTRSKNDETFELTVNTSGSSATSGTDFNAISGGMVGFSAGGSLTATVSVQVTQDAIVEDDETFTVVLSGAPSGVILTDDTGLATITNDDAATITLSGSTNKNEGNSGLTAYTFTATLNVEVQDGFQVVYTTDDGSATTADNDYTDNDGTLTFAGTAGEIQTITVNVIGDVKVEADEDFITSLGAISSTSVIQSASITGTGSPQTGMITNDDAATVALLGNVSQAEATSPQVFSVTLSNPVDVNVTLNFSTGDNVATTADMDYMAVTNQMVTFNAGSTTAQTVDVLITDDNKVETDEIYNVTLSDLSAGMRAVTFFGAGSTLGGTGTIENDDMATVTLTGPTATNEGNSGTTNFVFTATLDNPVQDGFTIAYTTEDGSATVADMDFVDNDNSLSFLGTANEMKPITVQVNGDHWVEADEDFSVVLGTISNTSTVQMSAISTSGSPQTGTILNDEIDWGDAPDTYKTLAAFGGASHMTILGFHLGALIDGEDDGMPGGMADGDDNVGDDEDGVTIPGLLTSQTAMIIVNASQAGILNAWIDYNVDGDFADMGEQIASDVPLVAGNNMLNVMVPGVATLGTSFARFRFNSAGGLAFNGSASDGEVEDYRVTIANTQFSIDDPMVMEGNTGTTNLVFTVSRNASGSMNSVDYAITGGSANVGDNDYQTLAGATLNFSGSELEKTIVVVVNGDTKVELDETVEITLSNPTNASIDDGLGIGVIENDDAGVISINNPTIVEGNSGASTLAFNINLSHPSDAAVSLDYQTMDGAAQDENGDGDYQSASGNLTFMPGQISKTVNVTIYGDCFIEANESFSLVLSNLSVNGRNVSFSGGGATLAGTGTVTNNDVPPSLTCPADITKLVACGNTSTNVTLPLPNTTGICLTPVFEFRHRTVNASNVPTGAFSAYFSASSNTKNFALSRYEIQWRVSDGMESSTCSYYLQINEIKPLVPQILGPLTICPNLKNIPYSITPQAGIVNYQWSYSGTGVTIHNNGTTNVTLDFAAGATAGQLSVIVVNPCGGANATGAINIQVGGLLTCAYVNCLVSNIMVTDNTFNSPGMPQIFKVSNKITSNAAITAPKTVLFKAGNSIDLLSGFKVNQGAVFVAEIEGCPITFPFGNNK
jgi:hypothetical protein